MKKRLLLLIILSIFFISTITFFLILNYLDPYVHSVIGVIFIIMTFTLSITCFFTLLIYFVKKVYFRGEVYIYHVLTSFRQSFFISVFCIGAMVFYILGAPFIVTAGLLFLLLTFIELFLQNLDN